MTIKLLLVEDHTVVRIGLRMLLENESDLEIVGEAGSASEAITKLGEISPDVIIMDIGLPDISGIEATRTIKELNPEISVIALTIHEDEQYFFRMIEAGASGYIPKRAAPEELITAIRYAYRGEVYLYPSMAKLLVEDHLKQVSGIADQTRESILSERERELLPLLADGISNLDIGERLNISPKTVSRHRENIMQKLNLHTRTELVKYAIRKGLIKP